MRLFNISPAQQATQLTVALEVYKAVLLGTDSHVVKHHMYEEFNISQIRDCAWPQAASLKFVYIVITKYHSNTDYILCSKEYFYTSDKLQLHKLRTADRRLIENWT